MKQHILAVQFAKTGPFLAVTHARTLYGGTPHGGKLHRGKLHGGPPQGKRLTEGLLRMDHLQLLPVDVDKVVMAGQSNFQGVPRVKS